VASGAGTLSHITCFRCGEKGHLARNCKKPPRKRETSDNCKPLGGESRRTESSRPTVASVGCLKKKQCLSTIQHHVMLIWQHSAEGWVCAWSNCNTLLWTWNIVAGSCFFHWVCLNDVTCLQTWSRLTMCQTWCLNPLPFVVSQTLSQMPTFLQVLCS